jgi:hypothetical protein
MDETNAVSDSETVVPRKNNKTIIFIGDYSIFGPKKLK